MGGMGGRAQNHARFPPRLTGGVRGGVPRGLPRLYSGEPHVQPCPAPAGTGEPRPALSSHAWPEPEVSPDSSGEPCPDCGQFCARPVFAQHGFAQHWPSRAWAGGLKPAGELVERLAVATDAPPGGVGEEIGVERPGEGDALVGELALCPPGAFGGGVKVGPDPCHPGDGVLVAVECHEAFGGPLGLGASGDGLPVLVGEPHDPDLAIVLPSQVVVPGLSPGDE